MNNLTIFGGIGLLALILVGSLYAKVESDKDTIALMQAQVTTLKADSLAAKAQVTQAHSQADAALSQANKNSQEIMNQKVSPECEAAIQWAIQQAKVINK